jgi:GMP synthase (glutamine-hydrolysing)
MNMLRAADTIFREEVEKAGLARKIAQYFVILTDLRTPGIHGGGYVCALRALGSSNAGKANAYKLPYDLMEAVVQRITTEVEGITHVVYDITGRPIATVEWE